MKSEHVVVIVVVVLALVFLFSGFGMMGFSGNYGGMMSGFNNFGFGFMWLFGWLFMALLLVALVLFIIWIVKQLQEPQKKRR
jgi:uncharacterized membrane protein